MDRQTKWRPYEADALFLSKLIRPLQSVVNKVNKDLKAEYVECFRKECLLEDNWLN